jgi:hypothetical protein
MSTLEKQRDQIIQQLKDLKRIRRGQISEQYLEKPGADGKMKRFGPYYVWQASVNGEKRSIRVAKEQADQVREDMQGYQEFKRLCDELTDVTEQLTIRDDPSQGKKNASPRKKPSRKK